jgi:hypothetical protein
MTVRAKFKCDSKTDTSISLTPVYGDSEENKRFFAATPGGKIDLYVVNKAAVDQFGIGQEFYVDFTPADAPQPNLAGGSGEEGP